MKRFFKRQVYKNYIFKRKRLERSDRICNKIIFGTWKYYYPLWIKRFNSRLREEVNDQFKELINVVKKKYKDCKIYISMPIYRIGNS